MSQRHQGRAGSPSWRTFLNLPPSGPMRVTCWNLYLLPQAAVRTLRQAACTPDESPDAAGRTEPRAPTGPAPVEHGAPHLPRTALGPTNCTSTRSAPTRSRLRARRADASADSQPRRGLAPAATSTEVGGPCSRPGGRSGRRRGPQGCYRQRITRRMRAGAGRHGRPGCCTSCRRPRCRVCGADAPPRSGAPCPCLGTGPRPRHPRNRPAHHLLHLLPRHHRGPAALDRATLALRAEGRPIAASPVGSAMPCEQRHG